MEKVGLDLDLKRRGSRRNKLILFKEKYRNVKNRPKRQRSNSQISIKSQISNTTIITRKTILTDMKSEKTNKKKVEDFIEDQKVSIVDRSILSNDTKFRKKRKFSKEIIENDKLEKIGEVKEDMSNFIEHFKKSWFYLFKIFYNLFDKIFSAILSVFFILINFVLNVLLILIKIIIGLVVAIYFGIKKILPKNSKIYFPFKKKNLAFLKKIDSRYKKDFVLFLDLDHTLVLVSETKPNHKNYETIEHQEIDEPVKLLYITKRNNLDEFLKECSKNFQLYIYTSGSKLYAEEITNLIDSNNLIQEFYSREDMVKLNGKFYKDLSIIRKQLSKVIILDNNPDFILQKENIVRIKRFDNYDPEDIALNRFVKYVDILVKDGLDKSDDLRAKFNNIIL